jgi:predicted transcriptional regulator
MILPVYIKKGIRDRRKDSFKVRRSRMDIIADILSVAREERKKTQIVYRANLNFRRVEGYLHYLLDRGLIENTDGGYKTTEKGKEFLSDYQKMKRLLT